MLNRIMELLNRQLVNQELEKKQRELERLCIEKENKYEHYKKIAEDNRKLERLRINKEK